MIYFCDFIQVYVFSTNHHLKLSIISPYRRTNHAVSLTYLNCANEITYGNSIFISDTNNIKVVFEAVKDTILLNHLRDYGMNVY